MVRSSPSYCEDEGSGAEWGPLFVRFLSCSLALLRTSSSSQDSELWSLTRLPPPPPSETQKGHLSWAGSLVCGSLSVRRLDGFPGLLDVLALALPRSHSPIVCHLQQEQSSYSLERLFSSSFHKIGLPPPPSVCPPNVAPYLRGISPPAFFLLSVVARGEKVADSVRPTSRLSSVQQLFRWRMRRRLQLS